MQMHPDNHAGSRPQTHDNARTSAFEGDVPIRTAVPGGTNDPAYGTRGLTDSEAAYVQALQIQVGELIDALAPFLADTSPRHHIIGRYEVVEIRVNVHEYETARETLALARAAAARGGNTP